MHALRVTYNPATKTIDTIENTSPEPWDAVCERFDNDVHRVKAVSDRPDFNALYVCYDEANQPVYFLVEEDETLMKLRRKTFLSKLGQPHI